MFFLCLFFISFFPHFLNTFPLELTVWTERWSYHRGSSTAPAPAWQTAVFMHSGFSLCWLWACSTQRALLAGPLWYCARRNRVILVAECSVCRTEMVLNGPEVVICCWQKDPVHTGKALSAVTMARQSGWSACTAEWCGVAGQTLGPASLTLDVPL